MKENEKLYAKLDGIEDAVLDVLAELETKEDEFDEYEEAKDALYEAVAKIQAAMRGLSPERWEEDGRKDA